MLFSSLRSYVHVSVTRSINAIYHGACLTIFVCLVREQKRLLQIIGICFLNKILRVLGHIQKRYFRQQKTCSVKEICSTELSELLNIARFLVSALLAVVT